MLRLWNLASVATFLWAQPRISNSPTRIAHVSKVETWRRRERTPDLSGDKGKQLPVFVIRHADDGGDVRFNKENPWTLSLMELGPFAPLEEKAPA